MDFGKLPSISHVNFSLPPDPPGNAAVLEKLPKTAAKPKIFIGATGWSMKEWVGKLYPKGTKSQDFLKHYARQFNTIELNTTHYRIPDELTIRHWHDEAAPDFRFCPKVLQTISHSSDLHPPPLPPLKGGNLVELFCLAMSGLQEKLGCCFLQLPPHFGAERLPILEKFFQTWQGTLAHRATNYESSIANHESPIPLAVELRHENWFGNPLIFNRLFDLLERYDVSPVITDVAGRRDVLHCRLSNGKVLIRFVGNNLDPTDFSRLDAWVERLREWCAQGLQEVYFFTHEPDNLLAPDLAIYLVEKLAKTGEVEVRGPKLLVQAGSGEQMSLF